MGRAGEGKGEVRAGQRRCLQTALFLERLRPVFARRTLGLNELVGLGGGKGGEELASLQEVATRRQASGPSDRRGENNDSAYLLVALGLAILFAMTSVRLLGLESSGARDQLVGELRRRVRKVRVSWQRRP